MSKSQLLLRNTIPQPKSNYKTVCANKTSIQRDLDNQTAVHAIELTTEQRFIRGRLFGGAIY
ncbi:hypothetical protein E2562_021847 [Oryza meyeriana var. granulata]|uniref:Uncharacterized protein n=1 Tax=Oryza meyeriana var. granulata TaxID=110450 RepID=A0A6G1C836_9ORYZ|nr:hypothetical protein E2562_021847 [Oryza meyeriana var. granulata]